MALYQVLLAPLRTKNGGVAKLANTIWAHLAHKFTLVWRPFAGCT